MDDNDNQLKKIVTIGPESTGKSFLCEELAKHYNTAWCPEYAREYLLTNGTNYDFDDLLTMAKGQIELEESRSKLQAARFTHDAPNLLFVDTDMYVMKVWCEVVFGRVHPWIIEQIPKRKYDLYLLCNIDLPWMQDGLREYPDLETREKLFNIYKNILQNQLTPWVIIRGNTEERISKAIAAVDQLLRNES